MTAYSRGKLKKWHQHEFHEILHITFWGTDKVNSPFFFR